MTTGLDTAGMKCLGACHSMEVKFYKSSDWIGYNVCFCSLDFALVSVQNAAPFF